MDDEHIPEDTPSGAGHVPGAADSASPADAGADAEQPAAEPQAEGTSTHSRPYVPTLLLPRDGIELLERQWVRKEPFPEWHDEFAGLGLTVAGDPEGFDYLTALTGAPEYEVAAARLQWVDAQLAADALRLGRAVRPSVLLVPAGRLWYVVRTTVLSLVAVDGPGYPSPFTAVRAARVRYRAMLEAEMHEVPETSPEASGQPTEPARPSSEGSGDEAAGEASS